MTTYLPLLALQQTEYQMLSGFSIFMLKEAVAGILYE
jgi:hypothetical protein